MGYRRWLAALFVPIVLFAVTACPGVIVNNIQITLGPNGAIVAASVAFSCISPVTGDVVQYNWVFGDGETATGQTVSHAYGSEGTFVVECHVLTSNSVLIFTDVITIGPRFTNLYWATIFDKKFRPVRLRPAPMLLSTRSSTQDSVVHLASPLRAQIYTGLSTLAIRSGAVRSTTAQMPLQLRFSLR